MADQTPASSTDPFLRLQASEDFQRLRRSFRNFTFPMTAAFLAWYLLYVLLSNYAPGLMAAKVAGAINVALVFGLLQFVSTFLIAWLYARYAGRHFDPLAERIREQARDERDGQGGPA